MHTGARRLLRVQSILGTNGKQMAQKVDEPAYKGDEIYSFTFGVIACLVRGTGKRLHSSALISTLSKSVYAEDRWALIGTVMKRRGWRFSNFGNLN